MIIAQALRKNREARIILLGLSVFMLFSIYDMLGALGLVYWPFQIVTWGFLGFQASLASILYLRYTETHRKLKAKYSKLYEQAYKTCGKVSEKNTNVFKKMLLVYAIGIEKHSLKNLLIQQEVTEKVFRYFWRKLYR